jgi:hypothetical protein
MIRALLAPLLIGALSLGLALPAAAAKKPAPAPPPLTPAPVVAAERAFAADGVALGIKQSFLQHMADDAIVFQPDPVNAREAISARGGVTTSRSGRSRPTAPGSGSMTEGRAAPPGTRLDRTARRAS